MFFFHLVRCDGFILFFFFSSRRRHTRSLRDWSSDVCSSDLDALARFVEAYEPGAAATEEVGLVVECGDGIARIEGLPSAMANELVEFEDGTRGIALNLEVREIGVVVLGDYSKIEEGQRVRRT